ncbi:hypothetical protein KO481_10535 [Nocardia sp. NEAU-G5]|uniref:Major facilitator superfamily (MFS) profile domain-containing protein n=1 Tax=Nocardia albiluteola TaxID=2842303 RepID=A0ABS6AVA6_9NOCA|nr:MFS transporter [Nocardia albiluteola]MBU3061959.1 hypothetical protein [Nocardia albiluteola]
MVRNLPAAVAPPVGRTIATTLAAMAVIESLSGVTQGYLNPILPALGPVFRIDDPAINGLFLISNVSFAVLTPILSRLGDSYGYRLVLRWSTLVVALGALLMAVHPTLLTVTVGVVALTCVVGFIPLMMGIMRAAAPAHTRTGVSVLIGILMIMVGCGGLLAGIVSEHDPTLGFWVAVPFAAAAAICSFVIPDAGTPSREPLAVLPLGACSLGLIGLVVALSMGPDWGWADPKTLGSGVAGVLLLIAWIRMDLRYAHTPGRRFLDLGMLRIRRLSVVTGSTFLFGFASISYFGTNDIFLHADPADAGYGFRMSSFAIALVLALTSIGSLLTSVSTARLLARFGDRSGFVVAGVLLAGGFATMALGHRSLALYIVGFTFFNLALGTYQAATRALSVEAVPVHETSSAAGLNELALSVGIAVGAAVVRMLSAAFVSGTGRITETGMLSIWAVLGVAAAFAGVIGAAYPRAMKTGAAEIPA